MAQSSTAAERDARQPEPATTQMAVTWQPGRMADPEYLELTKKLLTLEHSERPPLRYTPGGTMRLVVLTCAVFWAAVALLYIVLK